MCLTNNLGNNLNYIILYTSIFLTLLYFLVCYIKMKKIKNNSNFLKYLMKGLTFLIFINLFRFAIFDGCNDNIKDKNINDISKTNTSSTFLTTTTTTTSTTTTTTKEKTTTTTSKVNKVSTTTKGYKLEYVDGAYYIENYLLVNKSYPLSSNWVPKNTYTKITEDFCKTCIDNEAYDLWLKMKSDAAAIGLNIWLQSGYRSYSYQNDLYNQYVKKNGKEKADTFSARAGHSEHQSGLAFDLNTITNEFANTDEGIWVNDNSYLYGYIIRYPKGKDYITGYKYEPWHIRYVGQYLAQELYNNGDWLTMEEYFGVDSKYPG